MERNKQFSLYTIDKAYVYLTKYQINNTIFQIKNYICTVFKYLRKFVVMFQNCMGIGYQQHEIKLEKEAINFKNFIENKIEGKILGPVNAPLFRLKRKFRIRFLIRGLKSMKLQSSLAKIIPKYKFSSGIKLSVDVDPINFN